MTTLKEIKKTTSSADLDQPGERLSRILDEAGFSRTRGRAADFFSFLDEMCPSDWSLRPSTVRSWFAKSSPPMKKAQLIVELIDQHYGFKTGIELKSISAWWKSGGNDPFNITTTPNSGKEVHAMHSSPSADAGSVDSLFVGQVYLLVYEIAGELEIEINNDIEREVLKGVFDKILTHCKEQGLAVESKELRTLIQSILHLAKEGLV